MEGDYSKLKVAAVQASPVFLDREATVEKACRLIRQVGSEGADLAVFPESFIPAYPEWLRFYPYGHPVCTRMGKELFKNSVEIPGPDTDRLCQAAWEANTYVVMGLNERRRGMAGTLYNSMLFIGRDGTLLGSRQKLMPTQTERLVHGLGDGAGLRTFPTEYGPLGGLMCCENGNPLFRFALVCQGEALHAANWPAFAVPGRSRELQEAMLIRMRNCAWEGQVFVISSAAMFTEEMADVLEVSREVRQKIDSWGGKSAIIGPKGQYLAGPADEGETILYADIDLEEILDARLNTDYTGHYGRFDVASLNLNQSPYRPVHYNSPVFQAARKTPPTGQSQGIAPTGNAGCENGQS
ncbi:MAG: carbon-nitrogen hydrolase family protein [Dehalococcoidia bacterium]|nr:carbon-nitrogen hydrolase family protein [Dehalococcoidia bacterium]MDZ4245968.1 carbon-nitrogen hydrolase family protein [Dehalococcoidia bacterium]